MEKNKKSLICLCTIYGKYGKYGNMGKNNMLSICVHHQAVMPLRYDPRPPAPRWPQVETLLSALGRSDNAASAMTVLGPHAGKVKQAKEAAPRFGDDRMGLTPWG